MEAVCAGLGRAVFNVARGRGVVGEVNVGVDTTVWGLVNAGDKGVSAAVTVWVVVSVGSGLAGGCVSSISANLASGAAAARWDFSRAKRLRKLDLDDCRLTGLWSGTGPSEPFVLGYSVGRGRCNREEVDWEGLAVGRLKLVCNGAKR